MTHIWLDRHGRYTGIIDFGEIRGDDPYFDLGHFLLHDRETRPQPLFEDFLAGYAEAGPLPETHRDQIQRSVILSGLRRLSLWLGPAQLLTRQPPGQLADHSTARPARCRTSLLTAAPRSDYGQPSRAAECSPRKRPGAPLKCPG